MEIILFIIFCAFVGRFASLIMRANLEQRAKWNILIGAFGVVTGSLFLNIVNQESIMGFNIYSFTVALVSAITIIAVIRILQHVYL